MQHLVFGAGLIGCYLGACISRHAEVSLVCRPTIRDKLSEGIQLTDYHDNQFSTNSLKFVEQGENSKVFDTIWLTVKCTAVEQACCDLVPFVGPNTTILCAQNGLGSDHIVKRHFPDNKVHRVMVPFNVVEVSTGHYHRGSQGTLVIESNPQPQWTAELVSLLSDELLPVALSDNMTAILWAKLQLNLGNSINAIANVPVKEMLEQRPYRLIIAGMMKELLTVTEALNIPMPKVTNLPAKMLPLVLSLPNWLFKRLANKMLAIDPKVRTSMWWDVSAGKKTEIDFLNGAILEEAKKLSIPCPINEKIITLIKELERDGLSSEVPSARQLYRRVFN